MQGFLAAGHVCTVMGYWEYEPIAERYRVPIVVTGFEPLDLLQGIYMTVDGAGGRPLGRREPVRARRSRARATCRRSGCSQQVFEVCDRQWRGIGAIPASGYRLRPEFAAFDAEQRFGVASVTAQESPLCIAGRDPAGAEEAARVPGVRHAVHARASAGRADGLVGRRLRGLLSATGRA